MMQDYERELGTIKALLKKNPDGMSVTDISRALRKNKNTVGRYLDILLISGQVDMRTYGMAKVFTLSQRVPLSAMLSYSRELIMVLDAEGRITDVNDNFLRLLHLGRSEVAGKNIQYLNPPDIDVHELLETLTRGGGNGEETVTFRAKESSDRIFRVKRVPAVFEDGSRGITLMLEDITGAILAEREIRESEARFRIMAENIQDGLIILENDRCVYVNNRLASIVGYSFEELWSMEPLACIAPDDRASVLEKMENIQSRKSGPSEIHAGIIRKDGEKRYVSIRITVLSHEKGTSAFIIVTDITDLKRKAAALEESEARFRIMAENVRDGLVIIENKKIVFANRRMAEITGYSREEMERPDFLSTLSVKEGDLCGGSGAVPPGGCPDLQEIVRDARPGADMPREATFWITRKDGTQRCIQGSLSVTRAKGVISIYITATDITAFAEKEKALRDRIASLQELVS